MYLLVNLQLKSLKLQDKKNYFQMHGAGFIRLSYSLQKRKKVSRKFTSQNSLMKRGNSSWFTL